VTVNYSTLEFILCSSIWRLLNLPDDKGRAVTSGLQINILLTMFGGLCKSVFQDMTALVFAEKCVKTIQGVSERRNQLVHSTLLGSEDGSFGAFKYRSKGLDGIKKSFNSLTEADLKKLADDIGSASSELSKFYAMFLVPQLNEETK
jgi:hypothetical protein